MDESNNNKSHLPIETIDYSMLLSSDLSGETTDYSKCLHENQTVADDLSGEPPDYSKCLLENQPAADDLSGEPPDYQKILDKEISSQSQPNLSFDFTSKVKRKIIKGRIDGNQV